MNDMNHMYVARGLAGDEAFDSPRAEGVCPQCALLRSQLMAAQFRINELERAQFVESGAK